MGGGAESKIGWGGLQAEGGEQFEFEREGENWGGSMPREVPEEGGEEVEDFGDGEAGFGGLSEQGGGVGGVMEPGEIGPQGGEGIAELEFTEGMEFGATTAGEGELGEVKEVNFSTERGFGAARAAGDGIESTVFEGQPADDEGGFGVRMVSEDDAVGLFVHGGRGVVVSGSGPRTAPG